MAGKYCLTALKGAPNGVAALDGTGKVPSTQLPATQGGGITQQEADARYAVLAHDHNAVYALLNHNHNAAYSAIGHTHAGVYEPANSNIQTHIGTAHAPSNAQKNSDITKAEIEAVLTGVIASHSHTGGSDPWTVLALAADFTTGSATAVDVGLGFTPVANTRYMFEAMLGIRTATATVNPRVGLAWSTGLTRGVAQIDEAQSATARLMANGNIAASLLMAVGGIPNTTQEWPVTVWGWFRAGATPSGQVRIQLASETANTIVRVVQDSYLRFRTF